jgi:hypothetical protein
MQGVSLDCVLIYMYGEAHRYIRARRIYRCRRCRPSRLRAKRPPPSRRPSHRHRISLARLPPPLPHAGEGWGEGVGAEDAITATHKPQANHPNSPPERKKQPGRLLFSYLDRQSRTIFGRFRLILIESNPFPPSATAVATPFGQAAANFS